MKEFKYKSRFDSFFSQVPINEEEFISKASLKNLKSLIPSHIDFDENIDLMGLAFNAAIINQVNKNDDGMLQKDAAKIINNFLHKPTNIEHKKDKIVGHIISAGFSELESNKRISILDALDLSNPYNLSLGSVLYKYANPKFTKLIMKSLDPEDPLYQTVSTSWEVGFDDFCIAVGSKNLEEAEIISDQKQVKELKKLLAVYKGPGQLKDGTPIYRVLSGDLFPLGIGFTFSPAADVKGVYSDEDFSSNIEFKEKKEDSLNFSVKKPIFYKKNPEEISQSLFTDVNKAKETVMDIETLLQELKSSLTEKKFSQEAIANMTETFANAIKEKDEDYKKQLKEKEEAAASAREELSTLKSSVTSLEAKLQEATDKINEFQSQKEQELAVATFNSRMEEIDNEFVLEDEDRKVLAEDLKGVGPSQEAFASYKTKLGVFWKSKSKASIEAQEKEIQSRIDAEIEKKLKVSTASVKFGDSEISLAEALEKVKVIENGLPNNNGDSTQEIKNLKEKFAEAFKSENVIISQ